MKKRMLSSLLVLVMMLPLLPAMTTPAVAATNGYTKEQALDWIRNTKGTAKDIDGAYGVQCVDLIKWYTQTLGNNLPSIGSAYNLYRWPLEQLQLWGWSKHYSNENPEAGDIVVFDANQYGAYGAGHCGLIYAIDVNAGKYYYIDYNGTNNNDPGTQRAKGMHEFSCVIRPDWPTSPTPLPKTPDEPKVSVNGSSVTVSWNDVSGETGYGVYLIQNPWKWEDVKYRANVNANTTSYTFNGVRPGYYCAFVISKPNDDSTQSDWAENVSVVEQPSYPMELQNLGSDFYACISYPNGNLNLENRNNNAQTAKKDASDPRQIWQFKRLSDGTYSIVSMHDGLFLDADNRGGSGASVRPYENNGTPAQKWKIVRDANGTSGAYNILASYDDTAALDIADGSTSAGANLQIWSRNATAAQTFQITKVTYPPVKDTPVTPDTPDTPDTPSTPDTPETPSVYADKVSLNKTSLSLEAGKTAALTATVTPANATDKTVVWRSSNTSVAIVSNGTVTGVSEGGATITASCGNVSASCNVIVKGGSTQTQPQGVHFDRVTVYFQDQFQDVPANQWYTDSVSEAFELGLMAGTSETTFKPYGDITIAQAVTMAARIHSIYTQDGMVFQQTGKWYQVYLDYAYEKGIIDQAYYNCDVTKKASRAQFAEILANSLPDEALQAINTVEDGAIPDVSMSASYAEYVYKLYRAGILTGSDANGTFNPTTYITRAEAAAVVSRMAESDNRVSIEL